MLCSREECSGCFACYSVCPENCIDMVEDDFGYIFPEIDEKRCIDCGLCETVCFNLNPINLNTPREAYALWAEDNKIRESSTSGGAATVFSQWVLENHGVVYGAAYVGDGKVEHIRVDNVNDLSRLQGSKYVHSYIKESFRNIKEDLSADRQVIFFGTPCQVAGLRLFLKRDYDQLYLVDLICHGVPSQTYLKDEIEYWVGNTSIDAISFRGIDGYRLRLYSNNNLVKKIPMNRSLYYIAFMRAISYRDSCYECMFAQPKRVSDITIGDFWGLGNEMECTYMHESKLGISVVLPVTSKGEELLRSVRERVFLDKRTVSEAVNGNDQLRKPATRHRNSRRFRSQYSRVGFHKAIRKSIRIDTMKQRIKNALRKNRFMNEMITRIRNRVDEFR